VDMYTFDQTFDFKKYDQTRHLAVKERTGHELHPCWFLTYDETEGLPQCQVTGEFKSPSTIEICIVRFTECIPFQTAKEQQTEDAENMMQWLDERKAWQREVNEQRNE